MPAFQFLGEQGAGRLDAALALLEVDYYESEAAAVAAMFYALINNHPFQDGNKRYAIVATQVSLMMNGRLAIASSEEWETLALSVARGDVGVDELREFFDNRIFDVTQEGPPEHLQAWRDSVSREAFANVLEMVKTALDVVANLVATRGSATDPDD